MIKVELLVGGLKYNVTNDLKNWDEVEIALKREDHGGLIRSFSNTFEFVRGAFSLLENEYNLNYLNFKAVVIISVMNSELSWNEKYRNDLDVMTYKNDGYSITINAKDSDLASLIKAGKSQTYDIPVQSFHPMYKYTLNYGRMTLKNSAIWYINGKSEEKSENQTVTISQKYYPIPLAVNDSNIINKGYIETFNVAGGDTGEPFYMFSVLKSITINFKIKFKVTFENAKSYVQFIIRKFNLINNTKETVYFVTLEKEGLVDIDTSLFFIENDMVALEFFMPLYTEFQTGTYYYAHISEFENINVSYSGKNKPIKIDAFSPKALLGELLHRMTGREVKSSLYLYPGAEVLMLAAESIRGIKDAKVHTSFSKFTEWLSTVFGYTYTIEDDVVKFSHRDSFFDSNEEKGLDYVNNLNISIDNKLIYSGVEIGYEKNDYDEINGRDEFNVTNSYKTDVNSTDSILKLISPYRADSYGIEFLAEKRNEDTKDNESDNNLFFVGARPSPSIGDIIIGEYDISYVSNVTGVLFPNSVFNTMFSPRNMLLNNKRYIGACTKNLTFTASEGNADLAVDGVSEKDTVTIEDPLFRVEKISVDTPGLSPFPLGYKGLIRFEYNGITYKGFIDKIDENMGNHEATTYDLICRSIEVNN